MNLIDEIAFCVQIGKVIIQQSGESSKFGK